MRQATLAGRRVAQSWLSWSNTAFHLIAQRPNRAVQPEHAVQSEQGLQPERALQPEQALLPKRAIRRDTMHTERA